MDNLFITQYFDWNRPASWKVRWVNRLLSACRLKARLVSPLATGVQTSVEQRINLYHLASHVLVSGVPGDFVEIGCHQGSSAVLLQVVLNQHDFSRHLHVYDAFFASSQEELLANFRAYGQKLPLVHKGLFRDTLPKQLPVQVAFAHVDVGWGQPFAEHRDTVLKCLEGLYPRLAANAICVLADYCDPGIYERNRFIPPMAVKTSDRWNPYPAVKDACDTFLVDKLEQVTVLYGGPFSHGLFRKRNSEASL